MRRIGLHALACGGLFLLLTAPQLHAQTGPALTSVDVSEPRVGDLSRLLHVKKVTGTLNFDKAVREARLTFEIYNRGKKLPDTSALDAAVRFEPGGEVAKFALQAADQDYLRLGEDRPGTARMVIEAEIANQAGGFNLGYKEVGVPKRTFNIAGATGFSELDWKAPRDGRHPLFAMIVSDNPRLSSSLDELLEKNREADILVGYVQFE